MQHEQQQQRQHHQPQHQLQTPAAASGDADPGLMPLDQLPTFELPIGAWEQQQSREAAGGAAAAATVSVLQQAVMDEDFAMQLDASAEPGIALATVGAGTSHTVSL
jgi:hypothetical protein